MGTYEEVRDFFTEAPMHKLVRVIEKSLRLEHRSAFSPIILESRQQYNRYEAFHLLEFAFSRMELERTRLGIPWGQLSKVSPR